MKTTTRASIEDLILQLLLGSLAPRSGGRKGLNPRIAKSLYEELKTISSSKNSAASLRKTNIAKAKAKTVKVSRMKN